MGTCTHTYTYKIFSEIEISRCAATRVRKGGDSVLQEVCPPAWISGGSAAEKPEARRATEAVAARPRDVRGALRPSRSRDTRGRSDWGRNGGHMLPLFHTSVPPHTLAFLLLYSPPPPASPVSLGISTPPSIVNVPRPQSISYLSALVNLPVIYVSFCC